MPGLPAGDGLQSVEVLPAPGVELICHVPLFQEGFSLRSMSALGTQKRWESAGNPETLFKKTPATGKAAGS